MEYLVGLLLALGVCGLALLTGLDRSRSFYATMVIVVATYYVLFAVMGAPTQALLVEIAIAGLFSVLAIVGFKKSEWLVAVMLAGHGVLDFFHGGLVANPGVPVWWPGFCMMFDLVAGAWMAILLRRRG